MASEKFANLAETTLASSYTSAGTSLSVASASGFPTTGVFRVRLDNVAKTVWRVDSVSGTTFTGAADSNDGNASSGAAVTIVASADVARRFLQSPDAGVIHAISGANGDDAYLLLRSGRPDVLSWSWNNQGGATVVESNGVSVFSMPNSTVSIRSRLITAPTPPSKPASAEMISWLDRRVRSSTIAAGKWAIAICS